MNHYQITLIHAAGRDIRNVIAHSSRRAIQIAAATLPEAPGQFAVICKPAANLHKEPSPCCA